MLDLLRRVSLAEKVAAAIGGVALLILVVIEPDILRAPVQNARTIGLTVGGTVVAGVALLVMLRTKVPPPVRLLVLGLPFVAVNWWLLSPFFMDSVVDDGFATSIAEARAATTTLPASSGTTLAPSDGGPADVPAADRRSPAPVLRGSGSFKGLAGHSGEGEAGLFALTDGSQVLRFEEFDIQNGPDLRVYLVPGADRTDLGPGSINLGKLKGNVGDQSYALAADQSVSAGDWTVLVWCEAFAVEFVAATMTVT
ncbi:MAG: DM13 domain-containing protein [Acidimicrobiales bacterium]